MTPRHRLAAGALLALAVSFAAWAVLRAGGAPPPLPTPPARPSAPAPTAPAAAAAPVPAPRRDVFRFADEPRVETHAGGGRGEDLRPTQEPEPLPAAEPGPRLVGLVRRGNRLVAAFAAADGEVELAGPGESAAGVVVVSIGEDSVRVRRPDGTEATLARP